MAFGQADDPGIELDVIQADIDVLQDFGRSAARPPADEQDAPGPGPLEEGEMDAFLRAGRIGGGQDGQSVGQERDLLGGAQDLELGVARVHGLDEPQRFPCGALGRHIEPGDGRGGREERTKDDPPSFLRWLHSGEDEQRGGRRDHGPARPIRGLRDEQEVDQETGRDGADGLKEIDAGNVPAEEGRIEDEGPAQREADEHRQADREGKRRGQACHLSREGAQGPM